VRAVLWDLDGTLADSREFHWRAWRETMSAAGVEVTETQFLASFGQRNDTILSKWLGPEAAPDRIREIGHAKEALYRHFIQEEGIAPLPGAAEWVRRLERERWQQAIASSAPRLNVEVMARVLGFADAMGALVGAEDVQRGKPDPDVFLAAASKLGVPPDHCIVVEDAAAGVEAARRGGMRGIGIGGAELAGADIIVRSLVDLPSDAFDRLIRADK
jgi:beta-phosphoglucomutase